MNRSRAWDGRMSKTWGQELARVWNRNRQRWVLWTGIGLIEDTATLQSKEQKIASDWWR